VVALLPALVVALLPTSTVTPPLVVHVSVALCDNDAQGIVPVPKALGNGRDPARNLYWGARYGVRTHLLASGWRRARVQGAPTPPAGVLERLVIERTIGSRRVVLVADAWDGQLIQETTTHYLRHAAGHDEASLTLTDGTSLSIGGGADISVYIGHDGLMDFEAPSIPPPTTHRARSTITLACMSAQYFGPLLAQAGATPLVTTYGLMAPEAYVLDAALVAYARGEAPRAAAAQAYATYQKCGLRAARRLFGVR
jgi:hypothetical protein